MQENQKNENSETPSEMIDETSNQTSKPTENENLDNSKPINPTNNYQASSSSWFSGTIEYEAEDSLVFLVQPKILSLYGKAVTTYQEQKMEAYQITSELETGNFAAEPFRDSLGGISQMPVFTQADGQVIKSSAIRYNMKTEKGIIYHVRTQENEGFVYGEMAKRQPEGDFHIRNGTYTTCDLEHPHFGFCFNRMMLFPGDNTATGYGYLQVGDVPLFPLPQLVFPSNTKNKAGVIIPTYNQSSTAGIAFTDGGWYQPIGEYVNLKFLVDIYTRGTWNVRQIGEYKVRYVATGDWYIDYRNTPSGDGDFDSNVRNARDFKLHWVHRQDDKFHPSLRFNASVDIGTSSFDREDPLAEADQILNNTYASSIDLTYKPIGKNITVTVRAAHEQKTLDKSITLTFPDISVQLPRVTPTQWINDYRKAQQRKYPNDPKKKYTPLATNTWYSDLRLEVGRFNAKAKWYTNEKYLFGQASSEELAKNIRDSLQYGASLGTLSVSLPIKVWNSRFTLTPGISSNVNFHFYSDKINSTLQDDGTYISDTVRSYTPNATASFSPSLGINWSITGLWLPKKEGKFGGIKHTITPITNISYQPRIDYKDYYIRQNGNQVTYTAYDPYRNNMYKGLSQNLSATLSFGLDQQLEMKWKGKDKKTGKTVDKTIKLIEQFNIRSGYDFLADTNQLQDFKITMRTKIFDLLTVQYDADYTPYKYEEGNKTKHFLWGTENKLLSMRKTSLNLDLPISNDTFLNKQKERGKENIYAVPFRLGPSYTLNVQKAYDKLSEKDTLGLTQTFNLNVELTPTKNWRVSVRTGYDFVNRAVSYTTFTINRDLHCWDASFTWSPIQTTPTYYFTIRVKASQLSDVLKYNLRKPFFGKTLD